MVTRIGIINKPRKVEQDFYFFFSSAVTIKEGGGLISWPVVPRVVPL